MRSQILWIGIVAGCVAKAPPDPAHEAVAAESYSSVAVAGVHSESLKRLLHDHWELTMREAPVWATTLGDHRYDHLLGDQSPESRRRGDLATDEFLARARVLDEATFKGSDALTTRLFIESLEYGVAARSCRFYQWAVSPRRNAYGWYAGLPEDHRVSTSADGQNLLARYQLIPQQIAHHIDNLRGGLSQGWVANAHTVQLIIDMLSKEMEKPIESSPFYKPIAVEHAEWELEVLRVWRESLRTQVQDHILPAYQDYLTFLRDELLPKARTPDQIGLKPLPGGDKCYKALIRSYTTLPKTADELHQAGLEALKGIHEEFRTLGPKTVGSDDLGTIFERLRTEPSLYFESEDQVVDKAETSLAAAREAMGDWFGRLPQAPCKVTPIPDHEAPYTTIAYYSRPHADGSKPGEYYINTYEPTTRPRHEAEVLAFHEAIPGHHLQIAIAQELPDLPAFRKYMGQTAFVEGWALYTERLSEEMGLYTADTDRLGMLSFDAWRASRLVVDTGLHDRGWSRAEAEAFLAANTPLALNNIRNEVDRYITTPGQALAYKTGQIEMWRLRRDAEKRLGNAFDIKEFHDVVLGAGAVSLPALRQRVEQWVTGKQ